MSLFPLLNILPDCWWTSLSYFLFDKTKWNIYIRKKRLVEIRGKDFIS